MTLAALASEVQTIWWVTLAVGLVVAIVVVVLLHTLLKTVETVERNVVKLWETATHVARNTATTWVLTKTAEKLDEVKAEASRHDESLSRGGTR